MPDLSTLPSRFTNFTGSPTAVTPEMPDQLFYKSDETGGASGVYKGTGLTAGDLTRVAGLGGVGGGAGVVGVSENTPVSSITPTQANELYIQNKTSATPFKKVYWLSTGTNNTDWIAIGGSTVIDTDNNSPVDSVTSDFIGQRYVQLILSSSSYSSNGQFVAVSAGVNNSWVQEV
jgi:hypothetical protein